MCTLIAIHRRVAGSYLVAAANRDEYLDRVSEAPELRRTVGGRILAPLDVRAGGTWLGVNEEGVFVALTNLRCSNPDPARKSRGAVVTEALAAANAERAAEWLAGLGEAAFNPFNCFVADSEGAYLASYCERPRVRELEPGVHVIGNGDADGEPEPKTERIRERVLSCLQGPRDGVLPALERICREHAGGEDPLTDTCVHVGGTYGTRSSILLELGEADRGGRMLYADGPPCRHAYEDFSSLLHTLRRTPSEGAAGAFARTAS